MRTARELPPSDPLWASAPSRVKMEPWVFTVSVSTESGRLRQNSQHSVRTCRGFNEQGAAAAQPHAPFRVWGPCWGLPPAGRPVGGRAVLAVGPSSPHGWAWRAHPDAAARSPLGEQGEAAPSGVGGPPRPRGYISLGNLDSSLCFFQPSVSHDVLCIEVK